MQVLAVAPGPDHHGAVRHTVQVAALLRDRGVDVSLTRSLAAGEGEALTWTPFTDALFGRDIASAAHAFRTWAGSRHGPLVVTLHDVPGSDPDPARDHRRIAGYQAVVDRADAVAVCSADEAARVRAVLGRAATVVPLPVEPLSPAGPRPGWASRPSVGVLGFVYPGKGHDLAVEAARRTGADVVAIGGAGPGSQALLAQLREQAGRGGVELVVTGPLTERDLHAAALAVDVPLAAYATRSASASLHTWLACGRRPVAIPGPYADELSSRWTGVIDVRSDLHEAVTEALADPGRTWLTAPAPRPDVGAAYARLFASVVR